MKLVVKIKVNMDVKIDPYSLVKMHVKINADLHVKINVRLQLRGACTGPA